MPVDEKRQVDASHRVLMEVVTVLGAYLDAAVVVGGWVPEMYFPKRGHIGSLDVDLALDGRKIRRQAYDTIQDRLRQAKYAPQPDGPSNVFVRTFPDTGETVTVKLDLVTGEHDGAPSAESHEYIQGMMIPKLNGMGLAFQSSAALTISGPLPDGEIVKKRVQVPTAGAFVCMKSIAMAERKKDKDAYDIYFCLKHFPDGPKALAESLAPIRGAPDVQAALQAMGEHFRTIEHVGPVWAARVAAAHGDNRDIVQRDAFERAQVFFERGRVPPDHCVNEGGP